MRRIIMAFSAGMSLATSVLLGEEDLRTGGPWVLSLVVLPACALLCLAFVLRDHRRAERADSHREHDAASSTADTDESVGSDS